MVFSLGVVVDSTVSDWFAEILGLPFLVCAIGMFVSVSIIIFIQQKRKTGLTHSNRSFSLKRVDRFFYSSCYPNRFKKEHRIDYILLEYYFIKGLLLS